MTISLDPHYAFDKTDVLSVNAIRACAADTVFKSNSGHPGAPMGMAPAAHVLFTAIMKANPKNSSWWNRDRFVLSNGHACALYYIMLHLMSYKVSLDDVKNFRQLESNTPGHPEVGITDGIEVTTGPLGQGFANGVGLAIAQTHLAATFNKPNYPLFDNYTFVFTGDGCLQEGVASEAASLAGHLRLGNLIVIWDDNKITIDGNTQNSFTEDIEMRFTAYGWEVLYIEDGNLDLDGIYFTIQRAKQNKDQPTLIAMSTIIGYGSSLQGQVVVHGAPLKAADIGGMKSRFGFDPSENFYIPEATRELYARATERGIAANEKWNQLWADYKAHHPIDSAELERRMEKRLPDGWESALPVYCPGDPAAQGRVYSQTALTKIAEILPEFVGGSADLTGANLSRWIDAVDYQAPETNLGQRTGRYIRYGVREHAMVAICNGLDAYGGIIPYNATFLNFVSYAAGAVRLSALSHHRVLNVATHDSIGLGEDGPTHQPVETAAWLRALPNMKLWRPADGNEVSAAYIESIKDTRHPSTLCLSRQDLVNLEGSTIERALRGGYTLQEADNADITFVSTGSEVQIVVAAARILADQGVTCRIASLPCWEVFERNDEEYKLSVLPSGAPIISVEAYSTFGWGVYSHEHIGLPGFGMSGPAAQVYEKFGLTPEAIALRASKILDIYKSDGEKVRSPLLSATRRILQKERFA
ncbi:putative transketolase [Naematelia encephala]|uniref:Transketolase n=1 Tax=Naematelia encephala TaxID=71784 RepID=A0A1Y2AWU7_9TREE|nr:putative transketolase [Naematelia encephala]